MNKRLILLSALLIVIVIVAAAGFIFLYKPPATSVRIGYLPAASYGIVWVAYEGGFFEDEGLNITLVEYGSVSDLVTAFARNEIDGAPVTSVAIAAFIKNIDSIVVAGNSLDGTALVTKNSSGVDSISDLEGRRVGTVLYVPGDFIFRKVMTDQGISANFSTYLSPADALLALENDQIEAAFLWEPYSSLASYRGLKLVQWDKQVYPLDYPCCLQVFKSSFVSKNPDAVTKFIKALIKAESFTYSQPGDALPMIKQYLPGMPWEIIYDSIIRIDPSIGQARNPLSGYFNKSELQSFYQLLIPSILSINDYNLLISKLDSSYYDSAVSELKKEGFNLPSIYSR
ncbi:MAG: ABC transporter substrate-binding protein [Candidatus Methanosuratincola petrocarbonis]